MWEKGNRDVNLKILSINFEVWIWSGIEMSINSSCILSCFLSSVHERGLQGMLNSAVAVVKSLSHVQLVSTAWTKARQASLSMGFPDKNTGVSCHFLLQGIFPTRDRTCISWIGRWILYHRVTWEALLNSVATCRLLSLNTTSTKRNQQSLERCLGKEITWN